MEINAETILEVSKNRISELENELLLLKALSVQQAKRIRELEGSIKQYIEVLEKKK